MDTNKLLIYIFKFIALFVIISQSISLIYYSFNNINIPFDIVIKDKIFIILLMVFFIICKYEINTKQKQ